MEIEFVQFQQELSFNVDNKNIIFKTDKDYAARKVDKIYIIKQNGYEFDIASDQPELYPEYHF